MSAPLEVSDLLANRSLKPLLAASWRHTFPHSGRPGSRLCPPILGALGQNVRMRAEPGPVPPAPALKGGL